MKQPLQTRPDGRDQSTAGAPTPDARAAQREEAAHDKRNWVRLTFDCNNHCVFCLDTLTHDGRMRDREDVKRQILEGRAAGATRLILSGGEPTIHPHFVDFVRLGRRAGYPKIQTVTNGRLFAYPRFFRACLEAGLSEITFSVHGPDAKIHDALVGAKGAYEQEMAGLRAALADGRVIVNVDVVINRANVRHLPRMLAQLVEMGVREFDLLQVIPFGNAYREGRDILFYDLDEARPFLREAFEYSRRDDIHLWLNRFPIEHLDGFEHLIQDPYKLTDEVRGRREEFERYLEKGVALDCRDPARCRHCYLQRLCDSVEAVRGRVAQRAFARARLDTEREARFEPVFGGDPASAQRAEAPVALGLPMPPVSGPEDLVAQAGARTLWLVAPDVAAARAALARHPGVEEVELELGDYAGLGEALDAQGRLDGRRVASATAATEGQAQALLGIDSGFEVVVLLSQATAPWLLALPGAPPRLALRQPARARLTEVASLDVEPREFFTQFRHAVPVEGLPACVVGRPPRERAPTFDLAMADGGGKLEIFRLADRYIAEHFRVKARGCAGCSAASNCEGLHVNHVRAFGFRILEPLP